MIKLPVLLIVVIATTIAACSNTPDKPEPGAIFTTSISDNNSKLFNYSLRQPKQVKRNRDGAGYAPAGRATNRPKPINLNTGLDALLASNGYCREGYMVLEGQEYSIRGECQESATAEDRERFGRR